MNMQLARRLAFAAAACLVAPATALAAPIPIETLSKISEVQSISMSADGKHLVALIGRQGSDEYNTSLANWDLDNLDKEPTVTASGDRMKFIAADSIKSGHILVLARQEWTGELGGCGEGKSIGSTKTFVTKPYLTDSTQAKIEEAFVSKSRSTDVSDSTRRCFEIAGTTSLVNPLPLDPDHVIIVRMDLASFRREYLRYNLRTKESEVLFRATGRSQPGLFDSRNGDLLTRVQTEPVGGDYEQRILIRKPNSTEFEVHDALTTKLSDRYTMDIVGRDEESGKFYVLTDRNSDQVQAHMYDPVAKKFDNEPLIAHPEYSIMALRFGTRKSDFNKVIGFTVSALVPETQWVEPRLASIHEGLKQAYPGQFVNIMGYTDDRNKVLFSTQSSRHPPAYRLLLEGKPVKTLGIERTGIDPNSLGEQRWVSYKARDGLTIPAILDLPAGWTKDKGPLPTVIHPHGGPWARDFGGWDRSTWIPYFTSRGYAVLRPQYRGSTDLGRKLWLAGDAEWGQKMQDDKDDGAAWLVKEGIADPKRLVIFGYSYGGFAAAAAVVRPNSPYQCAISGAPVTDLGKLGVRWSENRLQRLLQGHTVKGMDPIRNTDKANIPVLLYVGDRDVRTPAWHAQSFYNGVKNKVTAKYELIPDQPHSFPWYPRHFRTQFKLMDDFLNGTCGIKTAN